MEGATAPVWLYVLIAGIFIALFAFMVRGHRAWKRDLPGHLERLGDSLASMARAKRDMINAVAMREMSQSEARVEIEAVSRELERRDPQAGGPNAIRTLVIGIATGRQDYATFSVEDLHRIRDILQERLPLLERQEREELERQEREEEEARRAKALQEKEDSVPTAAQEQADFENEVRERMNRRISIEDMEAEYRKEWKEAGLTPEQIELRVSDLRRIQLAVLSRQEQSRER